MGRTVSASSGGNHTVYNLGNSSPITLREFIQLVERTVGKKANIRVLPRQTGDMERTFADIEKAERELGYRPKISLEQGLAELYHWYANKYGISQSGC